jgi:prophage maintenance system killer protein
MDVLYLRQERVNSHGCKFPNITFKQYFGFQHAALHATPGTHFIGKSLGPAHSPQDIKGLTLRCLLVGALLCQSHYLLAVPVSLSPPIVTSSLRPFKYLIMASQATFRFLTVSQVKRLHARQVIAHGRPTQPALLESAVNSPMNVKHYEGVNDIFKLAANLAAKIMKNHAYQDGNKRTALVAADMFLKINGYCLQETPLSQDSRGVGLENAHSAVCTDQWTADNLAEYYRQIATEIPGWSEEIVKYRNDSVEY